jgi:hypothetical protein
MRTLAFQTCSSSDTAYVVLIHTAEAPDVAEWRENVQAVDTAVSQATKLIHAFVVTDGGSPDAAQRKLISDVVTRGVGAQTHVFTTDVFIRGVVTAFSWIIRSAAVAHAPKDFSAVCRQCGLSPQDVISGFARAQQSLPRVLTLERMIESTLPGTRV